METTEKTDLTGLPVVDSRGEEIGVAQRVHPDYLFTGDEPRALVVYRQQIDRVAGGTIQLNVTIEQLRRSGVNPARVGTAIDFSTIKPGFYVFGSDGSQAGRVLEDVVDRVYFEREHQHFGVPVNFIESVDVRQRSVYLRMTTRQVVTNEDFEVGS